MPAAEMILSVKAVGNKAVTIDVDNTMRVWDMTSFKQTLTFTEHTGTLVCAEVQSNTIISGSDDGTLRLWNLSTGDQISMTPLRGNLTAEKIPRHQVDYRTKVIKSCGTTSCAITCLAVCENTIVVGTRCGDIEAWDMASSELMWGPLQVHKTHIESEQSVGVGSVCVSIYNNKVFCGGSDGQVHTLESATGQQAVAPLLVGCNVTCLAVHKEWIVIGGSDAKIHVHEWQTGTSLCTPVKGHNSTIICVAAVKDCIISTGNDLVVKVWDTTGRCLHEITVDSVPCAVACLADTIIIALVNTLQLWNCDGASKRLSLLKDSSGRPGLALRGCNIEGVRGLSVQQQKLFEQANGELETRNTYLVYHTKKKDEPLVIFSDDDDDDDDQYYGNLDWRRGKKFSSTSVSEHSTSEEDHK